jgi:WhiB family redox-sensing transcriptional regulator
MASSLPVHPVTGDALWARVVKQARCADSSLDPDEWFPASVEPARARREADAAIAVCAICPVRAQCLELSLRHWDIGQHGVWGGLVAADRARLRYRLPADHGGPQHHRRLLNDRVAVIAPGPGRVGGAEDVQ